MIENLTLRVPSLAEAVAAYHALGYEDAGESSAHNDTLVRPKRTVSDTEVTCRYS